MTHKISNCPHCNTAVQQDAQAVQDMWNQQAAGVQARLQAMIEALSNAIHQEKTSSFSSMSAVDPNV